MQSIAQHNQNLFDIAIQENGNVLTVIELAVLNGISITDNTKPSQKIEVVKSTLIVQELVDYFINKQQIVATGSSDNLLVRPSGIGAMIIGNDFIVI
ncbi:hypothetical protein NJT12_03285 [Flavobacterium sp. AC]|uniref:Uncharacterized protein n=1 Tax=Flavobacterium azizsancarii TaxID=2961580 RepID=A0ABT4W934_9FLAO|nr:hypothetical protein [Flavobacterium azizsancarii]MDA6068634.1 hypothetical protein [Flavobacterium azizsancarii]